MRSHRERVVLLSQEKRRIRGKARFNQVHRCSKTAIQIIGECRLMRELIKSSRPSLALPFRNLIAAKPAGEVSHTERHDKKHYKHHEIVKLVNFESEARLCEEKVPQHRTTGRRC